MRNNLPPYAETLSQAMNLCFDYLAASGAGFAEEVRTDNPFSFGGIAYETTRQFDFALDSYKGRNTRKFGHISIYRMPSGSYELSAYVL